MSAPSTYRDCSIVIRAMGRQPYGATLRAMQQHTAQRAPGQGNEIWIVEHPPVFTLGQAADLAHVLGAGDIELVQTDRGGQVTYHGPGQAVVYVLLELREFNLGVKALVSSLEQAVIDELAAVGVEGARVAGAPGVYVEGAKIAALGLRVRRGCSYHGVAFNVDMDLAPYQRINPCGYEGLAVTQMRAFTADGTWESYGQNIATRCEAAFLRSRRRATDVSEPRSASRRAQHSASDAAP